MPGLPTYQHVLDAYERVKPVVTCTPLLRNAELDARIGVPVYMKCEALQLTGSFKIRGAYNRLSQMSKAEKQKGVVAFSSGNHAQGVARAARLLNMPATIVMPSDAPKVKIDGVLNDGADIVFYDRQTQSREAIAADLAERRGAVVVPSFDDPHIIAGQGSCGLEITHQYDLDVAPQKLICCVGGGGLIAGVSLATKHTWPETDIWGAEPADFDDFARSIEVGRRVSNPSGQTSICDALLTTIPGELTFAINQKNLSGIARITDQDAIEAVRFAFRHLKLVLEPGGAAALAALLSGKVELSGTAPVIVILTGGNIDPGQMASFLA